VRFTVAGCLHLSGLRSSRHKPFLSLVLHPAHLFISRRITSADVGSPSVPPNPTVVFWCAAEPTTSVLTSAPKKGRVPPIRKKVITTFEQNTDGRESRS